MFRKTALDSLELRHVQKILRTASLSLSAMQKGRNATDDDELSACLSDEL